MKNVLITGAAGELGQGLIKGLLDNNINSITCLDLQGRPASITSSKVIWKQGSILDQDLLESLIFKSGFDAIFHFAALLSATATNNPALAQQVNIDASKSLINCAKDSADKHNQHCIIIFPSSMAVYNLDASARNQAVLESFKSTAITLYGRQKFEIEEFGTDFCTRSPNIGFRSIRFPGIISSDTVPVGGTSDYASLMAHNAAQGKPYSCFVSAPSTLSFVAMPDAVDALVQLASTDKEKLSQSVYNLHGFTISAQEIADYTKSAFPQAEISFSPIAEKQQIIDSWPALLDCSAFCKDVGWNAKLGKEDTFFRYLFPKISEHYLRGIE